MATISAFGFGGTDHPNTLFEGFTNEWFARRAAQDSIDNQKSYDLWTARSLYPAQLSSQLENYGLERQLSSFRTADNIKNTRAGLEQAGYNPLLAVDSIGSGGGNGPILQMPKGNVSPTTASSVKFGDAYIQPFSVAMARQQLINQKQNGRILTADANTAESDSKLQMLKNEAEIDALEGSHRSSPAHDDVEVLTHEGWQQLRDNVMERLRKDGYTESEARARTLDILHETERAVDSAAGAVNSASGYKRALNTIRGRRIR